MNKNASRQHNPAPLGSVEPHAQLLTVPPHEQLLYKIMSVENLLRSFSNNYLHFNRVDSYPDFPGADSHDGEQLPKDRHVNASVGFEKTRDFTVEKYYDQSQSRTYACCFSLENSDFIWNNYANGSAKGKVCIVFHFGKLRKTINKTIEWTLKNAGLEYNGKRCHQIFSVNYGIVEYVDWENHQAITERYPNPINYIYLKDNKYAEEKELRVSFSTIGIGKFPLKDGSIMQFPNSLPLAFDFRTAIADQTIQEIKYAPDCDSGFLQAELHKLRIVPSKKPSKK